MADIYLVRADVEIWVSADDAGHARSLVRTHLEDAGVHYIAVDDGRSLDEAAADAEWEADSGLAFHSGRQPVLGTDTPAAEALQDALEDAKYARCGGSGHPRRAA